MQTKLNVRSGLDNLFGISNLRDTFCGTFTQRIPMNNSAFIAVCLFSLQYSSESIAAIKRYKFSFLLNVLLTRCFRLPKTAKELALSKMPYWAGLCRKRKYMNAWVTSNWHRQKCSMFHSQLYICYKILFTSYCNMHIYIASVTWDYVQ